MKRSAPTNLRSGSAQPPAKTRRKGVRSAKSPKTRRSQSPSKSISPSKPKWKDAYFGPYHGIGDKIKSIGFELEFLGLMPCVFKPNGDIEAIYITLNDITNVKGVRCIHHGNLDIPGTVSKLTFHTDIAEDITFNGPIMKDDGKELNANWSTLNKLRVSSEHCKRGKDKKCGAMLDLEIHSLFETIDGLDPENIIIDAYEKTVKPVIGYFSEFKLADEYEHPYDDEDDHVITLVRPPADSPMSKLTACDGTVIHDVHYMSLFNKLSPMPQVTIGVDVKDLDLIYFELWNSIKSPIPSKLTKYIKQNHAKEPHLNLIAIINIALSPFIKEDDSFAKGNICFRHKISEFMSGYSAKDKSDLLMHAQFIHLMMNESSSRDYRITTEHLVKYVKGEPNAFTAYEAALSIPMPFVAGKQTTVLFEDRSFNEFCEKSELCNEISSESTVFDYVPISDRYMQRRLAAQEKDTS